MQAAAAWLVDFGLQQTDALAHPKNSTFVSHDEEQVKNWPISCDMKCCQLLRITAFNGIMSSLCHGAEHYSQSAAKYNVKDRMRVSRPYQKSQWRFAVASGTCMPRKHHLLFAEVSHQSHVGGLFCKTDLK